MSSSHCKNKCISINGDNVPWTRELLLFGIFVSFFIIALLTCTDNCQHFLLGEINLSDSVILGVTEIQEMLLVSVDMTDTLRMMETCFLV
jgi:hypothetical protein